MAAATTLPAPAPEPCRCHICTRPAELVVVSGAGIYNGAPVCGFCHRNLVSYCKVRPVVGQS